MYYIVFHLVSRSEYFLDNSCMQRRFSKKATEVREVFLTKSLVHSDLQGTG